MQFDELRLLGYSTMVLTSNPYVGCQYSGDEVGKAYARNKYRSVVRDFHVETGGSDEGNYICFHSKFDIILGETITNLCHKMVRRQSVSIDKYF